MRRRDDFERDPASFAKKWEKENQKLRKKIVAARDAIGTISVPDETLESAAKLCVALGTDGLRAELTLIRAARALAAYEGEKTVTIAHLRSIAPSALRHRLRRNPLDEAGSTVRVERALQEMFGP